jgi:FkbM family methyltransferase
MSLKSRIRDRVVDLVPSRHEMAARYHFNRLLGRLEPELELIVELVPHPRRCLDIGANVGLYTFRLAGIADAVEAFEPMQSCADRLRASGLANVRVHQVALSNHTGEGVLHLPAGDRHAAAYASLTNEFAGGESATVELRTIDSYAFEAVDLIKIDVEGHELEVLEGARGTIERERPTIIVEVEERHRSGGVGAVFAFFDGLGYQGSFLGNGTLLPLSVFSVRLHQFAADPHDPRYVHNFIFQP